MQRRPDILAAGHTSRPMHQPAVTPTGGYINHRAHQPQKRGLPFGAVRVFACVARASASCVQDDVAPGTQVREPGTVQRWDAGARAGIGAALGCWCKTGGDAAFGTLAHEPGAAQCPGTQVHELETLHHLERGHMGCFDMKASARNVSSDNNVTRRCGESVRLCRARKKDIGEHDGYRWFATNGHSSPRR